MKPDRTAKYFGFPTLSTIKEGTEKQELSSRYSNSRGKLSIELPGQALGSKDQINLNKTADEHSSKLNNDGEFEKEASIVEKLKVVNGAMYTKTPSKLSHD